MRVLPHHYQVPDMEGNAGLQRAAVIFVNVHGFKGSGVQGSILVSGLHLGCVFTIKASVSSSLIQNLKLNWQLLGKMGIFNEDFGSSISSLSLTLVSDSATLESLFRSNWPLRRSEAALNVER